MKRKKDVEYLLDTSCWIEWEKQSKIGKQIEKTLTGQKKYTATAVLGELRKKITWDQRFFRIKALVLRESETIHCDDDISQLAGQFKKDKPVRRMGWVDYIIVSTSKVKHLTVCSTDHHFNEFKKTINVIVFE